MAPALLAALCFHFILLPLELRKASADEKPASPLSGLLELRFQRCRSGAPIPIVWKIDWNEQAIVQGDLDYEVLNGNDRMGQFRLSDLVLSPGKNVFNSMLPAMAVYNKSVPVAVRARFVSGKRTFEFEEQSLRVPNRFDQWFNVGVVSGEIAKPSQEAGRMLEALHWERLLPPNEARDRSTTVSLDVPTSALPADPLTMCNFDVVVLLPTALVEVRDDQADALKKWVAAGGSLCVIAGGGLTPRQTALLNDLLAESDGREAFVVDPRGFLMPGEEFVGEIVSARRGLGRVVMLRQKLFESLKPDSKEWLAASAFLMKVRQKLMEREYHPPGLDYLRKVRAARAKQSAAASAVKQKGPRPKPLPLPTGPASLPNARPAAPTFQLGSGVGPVKGGLQNVKPSWRLPYDPTGAMRSDLAPPPLATLTGLFQVLMPRDVRMVPLGLIGAVLAAYVLVIGPVDYCLLGLLRMRRFTWILFPVVTIAFAGFTLWLSRWYLGTNDSRQAMVINDVVKGGTVARRTRIELLFLSRERYVETEIQNGVVSRVGLGLAADLSRMFAPSVPSATDRISTEGLNYVGRFPSRYVVAEGVPQWTPVVNRFFWIDPKPAKFETSPTADPAARFDWDDPGDVTTATGRSALAARIERAFGKAACGVVYRSDTQGLLVPVLNSLESLAPSERSIEPVQFQSGIEPIVRELSFRASEKLFAFASQISPNGSPELEDLALLDATDKRQSLLVIAVKSGPDLVLYRRLYAPTL